MVLRNKILVVPVAAALSLATSLTGCSHETNCDFMGDITPTPLGTVSDSIWQTQEANAEASDFVIQSIEWEGNSAVLNDSGKSHVKQIATRAINQRFPIIVEKSSRTMRPDTQYHYPIHNDPELDAVRRSLIVEALIVLGIDDADSRVVVGTSLAPGFFSRESETALRQGFISASGGSAGR
jgi:hypothetical protein